MVPARTPTARTGVAVASMSHPSSTDFTLRPIGRVESPLTSTADAPRQEDEGAPDAYLILNSDVQAGLSGVAVGDEIMLLTWLHEARPQCFEGCIRGET
jgi:tRNA (Thr-GGU) A37 N-methylase